MNDDTKNLHNQECELFVLTNTLYARDGGMAAWAAVTEHVKSPAMFFVRDNALLAMVIGDMWAKGIEPDAQAVCHACTQVKFQDAYEALGRLRNGSAKERLGADPTINYEDSLMMALGASNRALSTDKVRTAVKREELGNAAKIIADHWKQRQTIELLNGAVKKLESPPGRSKCRDLSDTLITDLCGVIGGRSGIRTLGEHARNAIAIHDLAKMGTPKSAPKWGLGVIDKICSFRRGSLTVLAGTPGTGKTSLALQCAVASAAHMGSECSVGIVSREMPGVDLARILISRRLGIPRHVLEDGTMTELQRSEAMDMATSIAHGRGITIHDDHQQVTAKNICAWARQQHVRTAGAFSLLVVDHLQLLSPENAKQNEYEKLAEATHLLKSLALELDFNVLLLSQLNNEGQKRQFQKGGGGAYGAQDFDLLDLRGSGTIGQDADQVVILCNQNPGPGIPRPVIKVKTVKNRWGEQNSVDCIFDKANGQEYKEMRLAGASQRKANDSQPTDDEDLFNG